MAGKRAEGYGVPGFAVRYDSSRPRTAAVLMDLLCQYARAAMS